MSIQLWIVKKFFNIQFRIINIQIDIVLKQKSYYLKWSLIFFIYNWIVSNLLGQNIHNSSVPHPPNWIVESPTGKYYTYHTGMGINDSSLAEAQKHAITNILSSIVMERSVTVQSELKTSISETIETTNGKTKYSLIDKATQEILAKGESTTIESLIKEEEYWEELVINGKSEYRFWLLMKIPKPEYIGLNPSMMSVNQTYGVFPIVKSLLVPGWGQIHKKEAKKRYRFLIGFSAALTTGVITQSMSNNYMIDAQNSGDAEWIEYYNTLSDQYYIASTVSYILASAIYGYNVYDAISSKGAKIYALNDDVGVFLTLAQGNNQVPQLSISIDL